MADNRDGFFQNYSTEFITWFAQRPGTSIHPKIQLADLRYRHAGRGVVAVDDIEEGEELFTLQLTEVLSVQNSALRALLPGELEGLEQWLSLILVIMYERARGDGSRWYPYLRTLPNSFDTLAYWTPEELEELEGSAVIDKIGVKEADHMFRQRLMPIVEAHPDIFGTDHVCGHGQGPNDGRGLLRTLHMVATIIMAYAFDLEAEQPEEESESPRSDVDGILQAMIPMADSLNAAGDKNNAHLVQQSQSVHMIALKSIKKGDEIYNDYGQLPRSDLLRRYGYITDDYKKWDVVELDARLIIEEGGKYHHLSEADKQERFKLARLWKVDEDAFVISREAIDQPLALHPDLCLFIDTLTMDSMTLEEELKASEAPEEPRITLDVMKVLKQVLLVRRNDYETTLAEDVTMLEQQNLPKRRRMAVDVRLGEKEIIAGVLDGLQHQIEDLEQEREEKHKINGSTQDANDVVKSSKKRKILVA